MEISDFNPMHFKPTHRAKLWMSVTLVVILLGVASVYYFVKKTYDVKQSGKQTSAQQEAKASGSASGSTTLPAKPAEQAKQVSDELKSVNLAELQAAVKDIKEIIAAF